ncbi:MAG: hypothetical protein HC860_12830 [Alkalinema sp. RU_4_3]|nr:hypothetical protein [Alkalinema sp. RU_4_3]
MFYRLISTAVVAAMTLSALAFVPPAQADSSDSRNLKNVMDKTGIPYKLIEGHAAMKYAIPNSNGRSQYVLVKSEPHSLIPSGSKQAKTFRIITSPIRSGQFEPLSLAVKQQLLQDSNVRIIGNWQNVRAEDGTDDALVFVAKVDTDLSPQDLAQAIQWTATAADAMEQKLFDQDNGNP